MNSVAIVSRTRTRLLSRNISFGVLLPLVVSLTLLIAASLMNPMPVKAKCHPYEIGPNSPTGCVNDVAYGTGKASQYAGDGVARNDCTYPWTACTPIRITSLLTGVTVTVRPTMYCDCWRGLLPGQTGPNGERPRLVDLDPGTVAKLGLTKYTAAGLFDVTVWPANGSVSTKVSESGTDLPDTSMPGPAGSE